MKPIIFLPCRRPARRAAFTLVELMVVIVIIGALAALMFPMIRSMQGRAAVTKCTANLRGWSLAIRGYADDHGQKVSYKDWEDIGGTTKIYNPYFGAEMILWPEKKQINVAQGYYRMCPAQAKKWNGVGNPPRGYVFSRGNELSSAGKYAKVFSDANNDTLDDGTYSLAKISRPSQFLMMMDANNYKNIYRTSEITQYVKPVCLNSDKSEIRHGGGVNALFADGHIEFLKWTEINPDNSQNTQKVETWLNLD
jgi:prepilin-type processing-associated H-X9-DG protein/prepilin-type N-terminal cleavage/methylation domain-containing protein